jgi:hypothetical protein
LQKKIAATDKTVDSVRKDLEARSEIPTVGTRTDTKGRQQPSSQRSRRIGTGMPSEAQKASDRAAERQLSAMMRDRAAEKVAQDAPVPGAISGKTAPSIAPEPQADPPPEVSTNSDSPEPKREAPAAGQPPAHPLTPALSIEPELPAKATPDTVIIGAPETESNFVAALRVLIASKIGVLGLQRQVLGAEPVIRSTDLFDLAADLHDLAGALEQREEATAVH